MKTLTTQHEALAWHECPVCGEMVVVHMRQEDVIKKEDTFNAMWDACEWHAWECAGCR